MRVNYLHRHVRDTMIILKEGNSLHPWCHRCDMMVPWKALNGRHVTTAQCDKGVEWRRRRFVEEEMWKRAERDFQAYGRSLAAVTSF